jgi:hypothetical protein
MLQPTAMIMVVEVTKRHVLSARPQAPTMTAGEPRQQRGYAVRRLTAVTLRRLADRLEPRRVTDRVTPV